MGLQNTLPMLFARGRGTGASIFTLCNPNHNYNSITTNDEFRHGRSDPIRSVAQEMAPILAAAKTGGMMQSTYDI